MPENAWSLLVFTLLSQMSVGVFFVAEILNSFYRKEFGYKNYHLLRFSSRLFVLASVALAGFFALFHLHKWGNAYFAFNNFKTSWVSREMVFFLLFMFCAALLTFMSWRKSDPKRIQRMIVIAGILFGAALLFSMAKIYMLPTIPVWDAWTTPSLFFTAALLLGSLALTCFFQRFLASSRSSLLTEGFRQRWRQKTLPALLKFAMFFLVIGIFISGFFAYRLMALDVAGESETPILNPDKQILLLIRILFFIIGWILLVFYLKKIRLEDEIQEKFQGLVYSAFLFIVFAEIVGRYLFYASFYRIGL